MKTMMEMALLHKVQEQEMMLSPASSAIPTAGCSRGTASFAQERIWLDEKIHHDPFISPAMHNFVLPLVVKHGSMSIERIRSAVVAVLEQHDILRTAIYFDENRNMLVQAVQSVDNKDAYSFEITANDIQSLDEVADLLKNESVKHFAELEQGLVVRCHLVKVGSDDDMDKLHPQDLVIFIFHGVAFDYNSVSPFLAAFTKAYDQIELDVEKLQYISFSLYEHQQFINIPEDSQIRRAQQFWLKMMDDYSLDANYPTPFTRPFDTKKRTGEGRSTSFILDSTLVKGQMELASLYGLSMFHTALACFFLFIYELNDGTISDLCVTCSTENRSFVETKCMIGTFANILPYRIKINANESFINLVQQIHQLDMDILNQRQLPYQQIIKGNRELCSSKIPFHFQYEESHSSPTSEMKSIAKTNDAILNLYTEQPWLHDNGIASHDINLKMIHNQSSQTTYCIFECSADCYDEVTVSTIGQYFQNLLLHMFIENTKTIGFDPIFEKIGNLSLLPMNIETLSNINESLRHFSEIKPASYAQHQIWHDEEHRLHLDGPQLAIYNMVFCYRLSANHILPVQQLRYALDLIVEKHQSLRTAFIFDTAKNILTQRIGDQQNHKNNRLFIVGSIYKTDEQLHEIIHNETHNPHVFDLVQGLVFRCHLVHYKQVSVNGLISDNDIIIFNFHHASFDCPSMKIFLHDLHQAYTTSQLLNDDNTNNRLRYLDYAVIEQHMPMIGASMFWHDALHDCKLDQSLSLPYDRYRLTNEYRSGFGTSISFDLDRDLCDTFLHYTSSQNIALEHLALSMYFVFLFKLTNGETDLWIGMNVDGRYRDELRSVIGIFVNTIPLRCQLHPHWCFHQLIEHVREITTNTMKYSYFPLQRILDQHSHASKPAFLDTSFEFMQSSRQDFDKDVVIGDCHLSVMPISIKTSEDDTTSKFDFILSIQHDFDMNQLSCTINASLDLFNRETVQKISQRFHSIIQQLSASIIDNQTKKPIYELSLILSNEQYLMQSLNNTQISLPSPLTCIHHKFVYQVMKHPQKLAVELDEQSLTYNELLFYVHQLALQIINKYNIKSGDIICQLAERSLSMIIGLLSIEIIGGVYCPLSPENPEQRLQNLVEQTQARLILVHSLTNRIFKNNFITYDIDTAININDKITNNDLYQLSNIPITPDNISYIVFTSGSTGIPKAVQVRHRNLIAYMKSFAEITTLKESDNVIQMASCSFDNHFQETLGTLMIGAGLIMLHPHGNKDLTYLVHELMDKDVTFLDAVPSYLDTLCQHLEIQNANECLKKLRILCSGGDVLTNQIMSRLQKYASVPSSSSSPSDGCQLWNMYGQAEVTITTTYFQIGFDFDCNIQVMSIGKPLPNYLCVNMDDYFQFAAVNQEGELFVGGVGVFTGYLGRDDLTAKALLEIDGKLFYRTGDLVRIDNNGFFHYQRRKDHQIKLRGQRIELGEIERCLLNIASISACVVMKWNDDYLVAYVQSSHMNEEALCQHCQIHLPPHMIPSFFIILEKLPLNANGKIDRKSLPIPKTSFHSPGTIHHQHVEPRNDLEIYIHSLWCQILRQTRISIDTNFYSIGGHSILLVQLYHNYKMTLNSDTTKINIFELSQHLTIADHARLIHQSIDDPETYHKLLSVIHNTQETSIRKRACSIFHENIILTADELSRYEPFPVTDIQLAYLVGREGAIELGHVSVFDYNEYDFSSIFDIECLERALNYLIQRHEALRLIFPSHTEQKILKTVPYYTICVLNLDDVQSSQQYLLERREQLSHQIRPANQWPLFDFQITRFINDDGYKIRLHVGFDLLILDFWSIHLVLHELNQLYCNLNHNLVGLKLSYRDYILAEQQWKHTTIYSNDRQYWINRLESFPLGPNLPLQCLPNEIHVQRHCNAATVLDQPLWQKLKKRITDHGLTPAGFLASIYALVLGKWSENKHFALNLPVFNRLPIHPQVNQIVGDFTTIIP
ncbi:unnamed protein product, partial [Adineta steineri]